MRILLVTLLSLCFAASIVAVAQSPPNQTLAKCQPAGNRLTTIMGTVRKNDETLTFVTDQRSWNVDNPETLKGHEGHYVRVNARVNIETSWIHITEVKMPTASESRKNDLR